MAVVWKKLAFQLDVITKALLTEQGDIIYASAASTPAALPHGTLGQVLKTGGDAANPSWLTVDDTAGGTDASIAPVTSNVVYDHTHAADPHAGYILESLIAAQGDLIVGDADDTPKILSVGTDGFVLTADSDAANGVGVDWIAPAAAPAKATGAELDTGTDDAKFATAKALKDSHNVPSVAPSTDGKVMTSDGTDWVSEVPAAPAAHTLNSHSVPNGAVDFDLQQATDLVVFTVATEAAMGLLSAAATEVGQLCFCTGELTLHLCTESA